MDKANNKTGDAKLDVSRRATDEALRDIQNDPDTRPDLKSADLDEGELARKDNSNDQDVSGILTPGT